MTECVDADWEQEKDTVASLKFSQYDLIFFLFNFLQFKSQHWKMIFYCLKSTKITVRSMFKKMCCCQGSLCTRVYLRSFQIFVEFFVRRWNQWCRTLLLHHSHFSEIQMKMRRNTVELLAEIHLLTVEGKERGIFASIGTKPIFFTMDNIYPSL